MKINRTLFIYAVPFLFLSCGNNKTATVKEEGDTLVFKHARNICIVKFANRTEVTIYDPWKKGNILHAYTLIDNRQSTDSKPAKVHTTTGDVVKIPLTHSLVTTSVHCELLKMLGKGHCISGVCDLQYFTSTWVKEMNKKGNIADCGNSMAPNIEQVIQLSPDAIFLSPMQNSGGYGKIANIGIPIIEVADYMEGTPLGRAEWVKFYGLLFGCEKKAEKMFEETEKQYAELKQKAKQANVSPLVLMDKMEGGTWFLPGGKSTIAQMIRDANISYAYSDDSSAGSIQKAKESVVETNAQADLWLMRYYKPEGTLSLKELAAQDKSYQLIKAFKNGNIYGCNTATSHFFEETPFRPDMLLRDFIIIAHPEVKGLGKAQYFSKLE